MKIKRVQKKDDICVVVLCAASFVGALFACALSLSLSVSLSLSKFLHLSLTLRVCDHGDVGVPVNLPNNVSARFYRSRNRIQVTEACQSLGRNRKMAEPNPSNPSDWNQRQPGILPRGCVAGIIRAEGGQRDEPSMNSLDLVHHRNRGRALL